MGIKFPTDFFINGIKEKKLYYFSSTKIDTDIPHHYVCIKKTDNDVLILTLCTSQFDTVKRFVETRNLPYETLVYITPDGENELTVDTYVNCNEIHEYTIDEFRVLYESNIVGFTGEIADSHYQQILIGLHKSTLIDEDIKELLPNAEDI